MVFVLNGCNQKPNTSIQGKWVNHYLNPDNTYHDAIGYFKQDGSYDGIDNGKVVVSGGHYEQKGDTIYLNDQVCDPHPIGIYKMVLYAEDSMYLAVIKDSCDMRRMGTDSIRARRMR